MNLIFRDPYDARGNVARWLKGLARVSGVYVIRQKSLLSFITGPLYVGESHSDSLKRTILRHFQHWTGKTAGPVYPKTKVEVAIIRCAASQAVERQNALIRDMEPRDNIAENPAAEPF